MTHKHTWKLSSYSGLSAFFNCSKCEARVEKVLDKKEQKLVENSFSEHSEHSKKLHGLWWKFAKAVATLDYPTKWQERGYALMEMIRNFADKNQEIEVCPCDDLAHSTSLIAFIPHQTEDEFWGVSMICVPQLEGEPTGLFLYPEHVDHLIKTLTEFKKKHRALKGKRPEFAAVIEPPSDRS